MIPKSGNGFRKRSCSNNKVERDDDSKKSHPALVRRAAVRRLCDPLDPARSSDSRGCNCSPYARSSNNIVACWRSAVSNPSWHRLQTGASTANASSLRPCRCFKRARLIAVRNSHDSAHCWRALPTGWAARPHTAAPNATSIGDELWASALNRLPRDAFS